VVDNCPIPALSNEQLELQTQLHLSCGWRNNARRVIIRKTRMITRRAINIQIEYATNNEE
jgi:hypothetical protein